MWAVGLADKDWVASAVKSVEGQIGFERVDRGMGGKDAIANHHAWQSTNRFTEVRRSDALAIVGRSVRWADERRSTCCGSKWVMKSVSRVQLQRDGGFLDTRRSNV